MTADGCGRTRYRGDFRVEMLPGEFHDVESIAHQDIPPRTATARYRILVFLSSQQHSVLEEYHPKYPTWIHISEHRGVARI